MAKTDLIIYVVDDQRLFLDGMVELVSAFEGVALAKGFSSAKDVLTAMREKQPDVVLLDYKMPIMDGAECSERIIFRFPNVKIVIVTFDDHESTHRDLLQKGVHSILLKDSTPKEVQEAIKSVLANDFYNNAVTNRVMRKKIVENPDAGNSKSLTAREKEILRLICKELSAREIASQLNLTEKTVHNHRARMIEKLEVRNIVGLVKFAFEHQIT